MTDDRTVWVWSARIAKSGKPVRELVKVPLESVPPGSGFSTRHEAKTHGDRDEYAQPMWARNALDAG